MGEKCRGEEGGKRRRRGLERSGDWFDLTLVGRGGVFEVRGGSRLGLGAPRRARRLVLTWVGRECE